MRFAREVEELMAAYPGREFKVGFIVKYASIGKPLDATAKEAARKAVRRALQVLVEHGLVHVRRVDERTGRSWLYSWKAGHAVVGKVPETGQKA